MPERRGFVRYIVEARVSFKTEKDSFKSIEGPVFDISSSGWSAFFKEKVAIDTIVIFDLTSTLFMQHLVGTGKVVHVTPQKLPFGKVFRFGVQYVHVDKGLVSEFISANQSIIRKEQRKLFEEGERRRERSKSDEHGFF